MRLSWPFRNLFPRNQTPVGARARILGRRRLNDVFLQARLDAVGANRDVHGVGVAGCEFQLRRVSALFEPDATTTRAYRGRREGSGEYSEQIGPVHSIDAIPAAGVSSDDTSNKRSIHPVES